MNIRRALGAALVVAATASVAWAMPAQAEPARTQAVDPGPWGIDRNRTYDANTYLGTHNSYAAWHDDWTWPNQRSTIEDQLDKGVRALNIDIYLARQDFGLKCVEVYKLEATEVGQGQGSSSVCNLPHALGNEELQVLVAHAPEATGFTWHVNSSYRTLAETMSNIHGWLDEHPREVVTVAFQNEIHAMHQGWVRQALREAGFGTDPSCTNDPKPGLICIFDPNYHGVNRMPNPATGHNYWKINEDGFPTLNQMADADNRLVVFDDMYTDLVRTGGVGDSFAPPDWAASNGPADPNSYNYTTFLIEHTPSGPAQPPVQGAADYNRTTLIREKWLENQRIWRRMPQQIWFDFVDTDGEHPFTDEATVDDPSGPMLMIQEINASRARFPAVQGEAVKVPAANQYGFNNGPVEVRYTAAGDPLSHVIRAGSGAQDVPLTTGGASDTITMEGITKIGYGVIGYNTLGVRSPQRYVEVKIDNQKPLIECGGNAGTYAATDKVDITCDAIDQFSGVREGEQTKIQGLACSFATNGEVTRTVKAVDYADNVTEVQVKFTVAGDGTCNSGFETGDLTAWEGSGTTSVTETGPHGGRFAGQTGAATPTTGDSTLRHTFVPPAGKDRLSLWYNIRCTDLFIHAWAGATLVDNTTGRSHTVVPRQCISGFGWERATEPVVPGRSYTLILTSHDNGNFGGTVNTRWDDITIS